MTADRSQVIGQNIATIGRLGNFVAMNHRALFCARITIFESGDKLKEIPSIGFVSQILKS